MKGFLSHCQKVFRTNNLSELPRGTGLIESRHLSIAETHAKKEPKTGKKVRYGVTSDSDLKLIPFVRFSWSTVLPSITLQSHRIGDYLLLSSSFLLKTFHYGISIFHFRATHPPISIKLFTLCP